MTITGCGQALERSAGGIAMAGRDIAAALADSGQAPSEYIIQGERFVVVVAPLNPAAGDQAAVLRQSIEELPSSDAPTLLVLPPHDSAYTWGASIEIRRSNLYILGYGARLQATDEKQHGFRFINCSNVGILGLTGRNTAVAHTRWPERWIAAGRNGLLVNGTGPSRVAVSKYDAEAEAALTLGEQTIPIASRGQSWAYLLNCSSVIVKDNTFSGALRGGVRVYYSATVLVDSNRIMRTHSDAIHIVKKSSAVTVRKNATFDVGDDHISVVSYSMTAQDEGGTLVNNAPPSNILIEDNFAQGGRARGLTVVGGDRVVWRRNFVADICLAGFLVKSRDASTNGYDSTNVQCLHNIAQRCGQVSANSNSGYLVVDTPNSGGTTGLRIVGNRWRMYQEAFMGNGMRFEPSNTTGVLQVVENAENVVETIVP